mmetsp:Transcript_5216/g.8033  ORF Transcript_5216/g.8033 Transcript_5216/m.8033 type:complete len:1046 (-) Transcript_5216:76-3213(-)
MLSVSELNTFNEEQDYGLNLKALIKLGGIHGVAESLHTDLLHGVSKAEDSIASRREQYGANQFESPPSATWFALFCESFEDSTVIVLVVSAVVSLAVGLYESLATGWIEGSAILAAVIIVAVVTATNNYMKEIQFRKLNDVKDDVFIPVIREKEICNLSIRELVVGDVVRLNAGDKVPADGVLIDGSDVSCDESALTGESDARCKEREAVGDPFLVSGSTLLTGCCTMLVTAVGPNSRWGKIKAALTTENDPTPLQEKLTTLADQIGYGGMAAAAATFLAMIAVYFLFPQYRDPNLNIFEVVLKAFIMAVTIVVVAVPEGLPLAVTLSLAFSTQKMMEDNNLIRVLAACETMGNATNICSDKTGTLTQNKMTVVEAWIDGFHHTTVPSVDDLSEAVVDTLSEGIAVNTTATLIPKDNVDWEVVGNKTEGALLMFLQRNLGKEYLTLREYGFRSTRGDKLITFNSQRKCMSVIQNHQTVHRVLCKGAAEVIVAKCSKYSTSTGVAKTLTKKVSADIDAAITKMTQGALRVVALAHKEVPSKGQEPSGDLAEQYETGLVLDAIFGIKDPLRPEVVEAVSVCQEAGILVRMVTGDNIETAKAIATECGILTPGGVAMEGPEFRRLTPSQLDAVLPNLQVLARSSPNDKYVLVCRLNGHNLPQNKEEWCEAHPDLSWEEDRNNVLPGYADEWRAARAADRGVGEVVGVTGDGTNDGPALKAADVGLSMGLSGTDVAKDASDIVILDDNFASIVRAVVWGRSVFDNIRKFLQFQLTVNLVALTLTFVSAVTGYSPPLNAVMMLWVNLIMDTMGALALGTEPPSESLLNRLPYKRDASLISIVMWRNIVVQSVFQISLLAYLLIQGANTFNTIEGSVEHFTIVFNVFVFMQIFNEFNARSITSDPNIFKGLFRNSMFIGIFLFTVVGQYLLVEYGGDFVKTTPLNEDQWVKSVLLGALSIPVGGLMRIIPVQENKSDFARMSTIMQQRIGDLAKAGPRRSTHSNTDVHKSTGISYVFWLIVATAIPAAVCMKFDISSEVIVHALASYGVKL